MNVTRIAILGVAIVAGGLAFFLMMGNKPETAVQIVQPVEEKTVRVLVADKPFSRGERLTADSVRWVDWPEKALSESYMTEESIGDPSEIDGAVARSSLVEGEPIIEAKIVRADGSGVMAAIVTPGMRAVTMRVSPETASGGFILPGDHVDVLYAETDDDNFTRTVTLFTDVRVLAVNAVYSEVTETPHIEGVNITLEMTSGEAQEFVNARSSRGQLSLTLRSVFQPENQVSSNRKNKDVTVVRYGQT